MNTDDMIRLRDNIMARELMNEFKNIVEGGDFLERFQRVIDRVDRDMETSQLPIFKIVDKSPEEILDYWTEERMRTAQPKAMDK